MRVVYRAFNNVELLRGTNIYGHNMKDHSVTMPRCLSMSMNLVPIMACEHTLSHKECYA